ncbi:hypothetical protein SALBM311S_03688 [Streptomyces alboniger]
MFVISRLARRHGITATLRPSPYGGTTAIVLIPHDIVVPEAAAIDAPDVRDTAQASGTTEAAELAGTADARAGTDRGAVLGPGPASAAGTDQEPTAPRGSARPLLAARTAPAPAPAASPAPRHDGLAPLPRRVPQTSLVDELREDATPADAADAADAGEFTAEHAAASLGCFQAGTLRARDEHASGEDKDGSGEVKDGSAQDDREPAQDEHAPAPDQDGPGPDQDAPAPHDRKDPPPTSILATQVSSADTAVIPTSPTDR